MFYKIFHIKLHLLTTAIVSLVACGNGKLLCMEANREKREITQMNQEVLPPFSTAAQSIAAGSIYEHYKGMRYKILGIARHSETLEEMVVYQALYGDGDIWVRPLAMFLEDVMINGQVQSRFTLVLYH